MANIFKIYNRVPARKRKVRTIPLEGKFYITAEATQLGERSRFKCNIDLHQVVGKRTINFLVNYVGKVYIAVLNDNSGSRVTNKGTFNNAVFYNYVNPEKVELILNLTEIDDITTVELTPDNFLDSSLNIYKLYEYCPQSISDSTEV